MERKALKSPGSNNMKITHTNSQCNLGNGYTQAFRSRVIDEPSANEVITAIVTGANFKDGIDYVRTNQISSHWPFMDHGVARFRRCSSRARLMSPERRYEEMLVDRSDGLHLDLGSGLTLHAVCDSR
jgi:hypothetical protein